MSSQPQPPHTGAVPSIEERIEDIGLPDGYSKPTFESTGQFRQIVTWTLELTEKLAELMQDYAIEARRDENVMWIAIAEESAEKIYRDTFHARIEQLEQLRTTNLTLKGEIDE